MANKKNPLLTPGQTKIDIDLNQYNNTRAVAVAVSNGIKGQKKYSRDQIADLLSGMVGRRITVTTLNHWSSTSHSHVIPSDCVKAFCFIVGSDELKRVMLTDDEVLAVGKDIKYLAMAKKLVKYEKLEKEIDDLKVELKQ